MGRSVFKDESPLTMEYVPNRLLFRDEQLKFLAQLFRFVLEKPGSMSQRVLITGSIGTGKTVLAQRFGQDLTRAARQRRVNVEYLHINCREQRGSSFLILRNAINSFVSKFPRRGFSPEELLQTLMEILDEKNIYLVLGLDELEYLINTEGSTALYNLSRVQEGRIGSPIRLSLICILREPRRLQQLDASTIATLQRNIVELDKYTAPQLQKILEDRSELAFRKNSLSDEVLEFISDLAAQTGDARYAIELLWRAGKYADSQNESLVTPDHVRSAARSVYATLREDHIRALPRHEKLFLLATARVLDRNNAAYATLGEIEKAYRVACEEYSEKYRGHTQIWKYTKELISAGIVSTKKPATGFRGRTTPIGIPSTSLSSIARLLESVLQRNKTG